MRTQFPFIYNLIDDIDAANAFLFHVNIEFGMKMVNLLLLSYVPRSVVRNGTLTLSLPSPVRTYRIIQLKDFR